MNNDIQAQYMISLSSKLLRKKKKSSTKIAE